MAAIMKGAAPTKAPTPPPKPGPGRGKKKAGSAATGFHERKQDRGTKYLAGRIKAAAKDPKAAHDCD